MVAMMIREPLLHLRVGVGAVVVQDQVDLQRSRDRSLDALQERQELRVPLTRQATLDHRAVENVEGREQRGGAVADVVMSLTGRDAGPKRQDWLGAIQRLNLTLLI